MRCVLCNGARLTHSRVCAVRDRLKQHAFQEKVDAQCKRLESASALIACALSLIARAEIKNEEAARIDRQMAEMNKKQDDRFKEEEKTCVHELRTLFAEAATRRARSDGRRTLTT